MRVQACEVKSAETHQIERLAKRVQVHYRSSLVSVDYVDALPVPTLYVHSPRPVGMVTGDHQSATIGGQPRGVVERLLNARRFDNDREAVPEIARDLGEVIRGLRAQAQR